MMIANQHGLALLNRHKFAVTWNGGPDSAAVKIQFLSGEVPRDAVSIFGSGILTVTIGYLLRIAPGYNLYVRGPANSPKDGIAALDGIVESDHRRRSSIRFGFGVEARWRTLLIGADIFPRMS
jgi:hypothetical protein